MDSTLVASVSFRDGTVALTAGQLLFLRSDGTLRSAFALQHVSDAAVEYEHSFRHRILGLLCAAALFGLSVMLGGIFQGGDVTSMPQTMGRIGIGSLFAFLFGLLFLVGVLRSRRVHWLCFRYAGVRRRIDVPDVMVAELEKIVVLLPHPIQ
jgi:hypothetical protein